ncbi:MAG: serine hydrolase domain-containing protein [Planctomycetota bacterium]
MNNKKHMAMVLPIWLFVFLAISCLTSAKTPPRDPELLRINLEEIRKDCKVPALAASIIIGDQIIASSAVGVRKWDTNVSVTRNDAFELGSITKLITGTLIGVLKDQGYMNWNTTIGEIFPEIFPTCQSIYQEIKIYQLLSHTSGLSRHPELKEAIIENQNIDIISKRLSYVTAALSEKPEAKPGTQYIYSGGTIIVASMAERKTGKPWEELVSKNIFEKLGMNTAGFGPMATPPDKIDAPWFHQSINGKITPIEPKAGQDILYGNPGGRSVHCSVIDLGKFATFHLSGLKNEKNPTPLVKQETLRQIYKVVHIKPKKLQGKVYTVCGWRVQPVKWSEGNLVYWHSGQSKGRGYAVLTIVPKLNYAICVMTNIGGDNAYKAADETREMLVKELVACNYNCNNLFKNTIINKRVKDRHDY